MRKSAPEGREGGRSRKRRFGPGWVVTAAFIGPGTVTTATIAGASFGAALLWAVAFSTVATIALQEMAARLGLVTGRGLGESIRDRFEGRARWAAAALVVAAIGVGNGAYETGNLLGAGLGLEAALGIPVVVAAVAVAAVAAVLLWTGSYSLLERILVALVAVMGVTFLATAAVVALAGDVDGTLRGLVVPSLPDGSALVALALVGTTVVPYNLFLHAAAAGERWSGEADLPAARLDLVISIALGGAVTAAIVVTAAGTIGGTGAGIDGAADMARQLEPLLGGWARVFFAVGLFAAGMTSAITAPLAAAYATAGVLGWPRDLTAARSRAVWGAILATGVGFAVAGVRPVSAILFAQAANGVLLPAVAAFLLVSVNDRRTLGRRANGALSNAFGVLVVLVALALGARAVLGALRSL
ncbi:MAG TPA: Nramp family divalent metal transporter [Gemmatimonadota bacterium]|nr:Nramp family divalent metal transporter [Gemmatimonadota bacterium]